MDSRLSTMRCGLFAVKANTATIGDLVNAVDSLNGFLATVTSDGEIESSDIPLIIEALEAARSFYAFTPGADRAVAAQYKAAIDELKAQQAAGQKHLPGYHPQDTHGNGHEGMTSITDVVKRGLGATTGGLSRVSRSLHTALSASAGVTAQKIEHLSTAIWNAADSRPIDTTIIHESLDSAALALLVVADKIERKYPMSASLNRRA